MQVGYKLLNGNNHILRVFQMPFKILFLKDDIFPDDKIFSIPFLLVTTITRMHEK